MEETEAMSIIEALLFIWGEPLNIREISKVLDMNRSQVENILKKMIDDFDFNRRGLKIVTIDDSYQLSTRPEHHSWISKLSQDKSSKSLSTAALETLSIIAYKQPITKNELEAIRGVRCDSIVNTLVNRDLVEERGRLERIGRPIVYGTTKEFLRYFGLESLVDLPPIEDFEDASNENEIENQHREGEIK